MKLTDWFDGDTKPSRVGVYERSDEGTWLQDGKPNYSYWDGHKWGLSTWAIENSVGWAGVSSTEQRLPWRGLADDPKKARKKAQK